MKRNTATTLRFAILLSGAALPVAVVAQQAATDPYIWLEDIDGQRSMDWVNAHNAGTVAELSATPYRALLWEQEIAGSNPVAPMK